MNRRIRMTFYRGIQIWFDENGDYVVEDGNKTVRFPTEPEAQEYIDEVMEQMNDVGL